MTTPRSEIISTQDASATAAASNVSTGTSYKVPAGEKTIDVIEYMARSGTPRTKSEIAAGVGKSIQEIYRIIQLLLSRGYLVAVDDGDRYSLSMKLFSLAHAMPAVLGLSEASVGPMRWLVNRTSQSCHVGVLSGTQLMVVSQLSSPLNMSYSVALGAHFPVHETSSGIVLLANLSPERREALLQSIEATLAPDERPDEVRKRVEEVRESGHDIRPSLMVPGIVNIAFPIRGLRGEVVATLTVPYLGIKHATLSVEETAEATAYAAQRISQAMGCPRIG